MQTPPPHVHARSFVSHVSAATLQRDDAISDMLQYTIMPSEVCVVPVMAATHRHADTMQTCSKPDTTRAQHRTYSIAQKQIPLYNLEQMRYKVVCQVHPKGEAVGVEQGLADMVHNQLCQGC